MLISSISMLNPNRTSKLFYQAQRFSNRSWRDDQGVFDSIYKDFIDNVITNLKNNLCHKTLYKWQNFKVKVRVGEDHLKEDLKKTHEKHCILY